MKNIVIFGGTTEGRLLAQWCDENKIKVHISVTTSYGAELLPVSENVVISEGKMNVDELVDFMRENFTDIVIDATHPYAKEVTKNILTAIKNYGENKIKYYRVIRQSDKIIDGAEYFDTIKDVVQYLNSTKGNIFVTTGSKELEEISKIKDFKHRCTVRVLDSMQVLEECYRLGFEENMVIQGKGPFTLEDNLKHLKESGASFMVTKESGIVGGFKEKIDAAGICGVKVLIIKRQKERGVSMREMKNILSEKQINIVGTGMNGKLNMTLQAIEAVKEAEVIIGADRMVKYAEEILNDEVSGGIEKRKVFISYKPSEIKEFIDKTDKKIFTVLMSGDTGFYSGTKALIPMLEGYDLRIVNGIASPVYFAGKIGMTWQDMKFVSLHGTTSSVVRNVCENEKTFFLLGGELTASDVCTRLDEYGKGDVMVYIGENLMQENETIYTGTALENKDVCTDSLCVMIVVNKDFERTIRSGIPDNQFVRGKTPMTKSEVRSVCIALMEIEKNDICWDIGCGTGSVSVEMAFRCPEGKVISIDKKDEAILLTDMNRHRLRCDNIELVSGDAAEKAVGFDRPDVVFIGGSGGKLREIINVAYEKNPDVRLLVMAVSLETLGNITKILTEMNIKHMVTQIAVTRTNKAGAYTMFAAENPVFIIKSLISGVSS